MNSKHETSISKIQRLFSEWDKGCKQTRVKILADFIDSNQNKTGPELDHEFAQAASLFLARITAWLRLTYMLITPCLIKQLEALKVFLSAASSHHFLAEFLEVGGVLTLLEILSLKDGGEAEKREALRLLQAVADSGRKYKELICESYGMKAVAECLAHSAAEETKEDARALLEALAKSNPRYEMQIYKGLIALLPANCPKAQQMAARTLRIVQPLVKTASPAIVDPLLGLLRTLHLEVQFEAIELIKDSMDYAEAEDPLLRQLVALLTPIRENTAEQQQGKDPGAAAGKSGAVPPGGQTSIDVDVSQASTSGFSAATGAPPPPPLLTTTNPGVGGVNSSSNNNIANAFKTPLPIHVQQAAAAKTLGILARESPHVAQKLLHMGVVHGLMVAMGNEDHSDSQRQAALSLELFVTSYPFVDDEVRTAMGESLYNAFAADPERLPVNLTPVQADVLRTNRVNIVAMMPNMDAESL